MATPRNTREDKQYQLDRKSGDPSDQQDRISYGEITEIVPNNGQVYVRMYGDEPQYLLADHAHRKGKPVPIIQPINFINAMYGALHVGMKVRIFWIGKNDAKSAFVEVIGSEDFNLRGILNKEPESNRQETMPYLSVSGGILV